MATHFLTIGGSMNDCIHVSDLITLCQENYPIRHGRDLRQYASQKSLTQAILHYSGTPMQPISVDEAARYIDGEDMFSAWRSRLIADAKRVAKS